MKNKTLIFPLTSLYLYLSDHCNLHCGHCWISPALSQKRQEGIPLAPLKKVISEAKGLGLQSVKLTGGEPLLYQDIGELLAFLAAEGVSLSVETNGTLIDEALLNRLQSCEVNQISVSLDAADEKLHDEIRGVKGSFRRALEGLRRLTEFDFNPQIIMTLQRKNSREIGKLIQLSQGLGADSIKINPLIPCGRANDVFAQGQNLGLDELIRLYRKVNEDHPSTPDFEVLFDLPLAFRSISEIKRGGTNECHILSILGILANGDISICGIGETIDELRMGNIHKDAIQEVWLKNPVLEELRQSLPGRLQGICGRCIFKFQCLGACRANAYALTKDLYAPYFLCEAFFDAGLFPESRYMTDGEGP